jgi:hypothetical protein
LNTGPPRAERRRKKKEKIGPVLLVNHFILTISILSNGPKGKNEIYRLLQKPKEIFPSLQNYEIPDIPRLGRKPNTLQAIRYLDQGELIQQIEEDSNKKNFELTPFGCEVAKFIDSINSFVINYSNFKKQYKEKFPFSYSTNIDTKNKFKLEKSGWKKEVKNYSKYLRETELIDYELTNAYIQALLARYISILLKYDITNFGKQVLGTIFLETLNKFIQSKNESLKDLQIDDKILFFLHNICSDFNNFLIRNSPSNKSNRFIQKELDEILKSLSKILSPPKGYFKRPIIIGKEGDDNDLKEKYDYLLKLFG